MWLRFPQFSRRGKSKLDRKKLLRPLTERFNSLTCGNVDRVYEKISTLSGAHHGVMSCKPDQRTFPKEPQRLVTIMGSTGCCILIVLASQIIIIIHHVHSVCRSALLLFYITDWSKVKPRLWFCCSKLMETQMILAAHLLVTWICVIIWAFV